MSLYTIINSFTTGASQNLYLLLMSKPLLTFSPVVEKPTVIWQLHLMYLWAPDPTDPGLEQAQKWRQEISAVQMKRQGKKKKSWNLDLRELRENFPAQELCLSRDAIVSIDLDSLAWNKGAWVPHLFSSVILNSCSEVNTRWSAYNPFSK